METLSARWLSDLEMDDYNFNFHSHPNPCNNDHRSTGLNLEHVQLQQQQYLFSQKTLATCSGSSIESSQTTSCFERPVKQLKTNTGWTSGTGATTDQQLSHNPSPGNSISTASSSHLLSFGSTTSIPKDEAVSQGYVQFTSLGTEGTCGGQKCIPKSANKRACPTMRTPSSALDHIMAERKRREKLNQRFIALCAIVPGLKKVDKASVLGDAIKYLKLLQERVKVLEEQTRKKTVESAVIIKRSHVSGADDISPCNNNSDGQLDDTLPEIEGRVSDKDVLIRIHTDKRKGFVPAIVRVIENLHLSIVNSSIVPFGPSNLDITIVAQMEDEFCITAKDLVRKLRAASVEFMRHA